MTDPARAQEVAGNWLKQSFLTSGRSLQDVPLCIRSRSIIHALQEIQHDQ